MKLKGYLVILPFKQEVSEPLLRRFALAPAFMFGCHHARLSLIIFDYVSFEHRERLGIFPTLQDTETLHHFSTNCPEMSAF